MRIRDWSSDVCSSDLPAIGGDTLVGQPQAPGRGAGLPEDVDRNAAARIPIAADAQPFRPHLVEQAPADADGAILVEPRVTPKAGEEQLEALRFDDRRAGGVVDDEVREIGLAGHRTERSEEHPSELQ